MSTSNQVQYQPDFYLQVEDFIIGSVSTDTTGDHALNNEIGMFLLMLVHHHKVQEQELELR
ncbi:hypothetical protein [Vibrio sp. 99-8-1]|uniref:hypothetical protein n=1 Tax=Vibrio sp. 99-8-1 TaxID=2607602 RepID=UPI001493AE62|nr:hypothetical protein [Vibrio sp. 99-8-1]NOI65987.1 hypothetical protein [Vibrio sp. 99-8-1]